MIIYIIDQTLDAILSAVFDAYSFHEIPDEICCGRESLPLFANRIHQVITTEEKAQRVWKGLEKKVSHQALHVISVSYLSELKELNKYLFHYIYKVFSNQSCFSIERNFSDEDVLYVTNTFRKVNYESLRMKQFVRFQKAKDGTYLAVVKPDYNVLPLAIDHFQDRFNDQSFLLFDIRRHYGFYHDQHTITRITFEENQTLPFDLENGKLDESLLAENDKIFQDLWRTYFKAICIKERLNSKKQASDMPRRYWKYMTEKQ